MILRPAGRIGGSLARPRPRAGAEEDGDGWLVSYADMVSLLLAFFVSIVAIVGLDEPTLENLVSGFIAETGGTGDAARGREARDLAIEVRSTVAALPFGENASVVEGDGTVAIELAGAIAFPRGSAELDPEAVALVRGLAELLRDKAWRAFAIAVEGHTDAAPITTARFPSHWELAAARATAVVRLLEAFGVAPGRLSAVGLGSSHPPSPGQPATDRLVIRATR